MFKQGSPACTIIAITVAYKPGIERQLLQRLSKKKDEAQ
jgi:hypothetical protein